jgi:lipopolysaccharide/colanic/teichoic acid biosynthesis glycosyltransferase
VAALVRTKFGSPVIFRQQRPGLDGRPFTILKFRTMTEDRDEQGQLLPNHERLTSFGRILRGTSLDELPELWNVIKGDMSLVGPRPLMLSYLPLYSERQRRRHEVRPGITGWAQINGRNTISWGEKLEFDVWYVENMSFLLDVKIICLTLLKVVGREGVNLSESVTMPPFNGTN